MVAVIIGGSGSGKSEYAENLAIQFTQTGLVYIATMQPFDQESIKRVERHQKMRQEKNFKTIECYTDLGKVEVDTNTTILLECMSNLVANEMFSDSGAKAKANEINNSRKGTNETIDPDEFTIKALKKGIQHLIHQADNLIIVTNNIFEDGYAYDLETMKYLKALGIINQWISSRADQVIEVVHGISIEIK